MICSKCNKEKNENDFYLKNTQTGKRQGVCKNCKLEEGKEHYKKNKSKYIFKAIQSNKKILEWYRNYKSTLKCSRCEENHPSTLDFHHLDPSQKENTVFNILQSKGRLRAIEEIKKCIVLCSNCHRKLHWKEKYGDMSE